VTGTLAAQLQLEDLGQSGPCSRGPQRFLTLQLLAQHSLGPGAFLSGLVSAAHAFDPVFDPGEGACAGGGGFRLGTVCGGSNANKPRELVEELF